MDQNTIDRLFREKLDGVEITPSAKAWNQVEGQIRGKKTPMVYWVAASVTLLLISWIVWPQQENTIVGVASGPIDHPVVQVDRTLTTPIAAKLKEKDQAVLPILKKAPVSNQAPLVAEVKSEDRIESIPEYEIEEVINDKAVATIDEEEVPLLMEMSDQIDPIMEEVDSVMATVKITYIASSSTSSKPTLAEADSAGVFKKFIAFTEKIDPGEMLADIKTAKDNLLNGGLRNKKDRTLMTP